MKSRRRLALVLGALSTFGPLSTDMYLPGLPALARDLRLGEAQTQLTLTACFAGMAVGQLVAGPLSDTLGRRRPLVVAVSVFALTSLACAFARDGLSLVLLRLVQGLAGGGGLVIARTIVRDLYSGAEAAAYYSALMLISGLAPIVGPLVGGALLTVTSWHGLFVLLAGIGAVLTVAAWFGIPETLPVASRRARGLGPLRSAAGVLVRDTRFVGFAASIALGFGVIGAYLAGSSFVVEDVYGASPQVYAVLFAVNSGGIVAASQLNRRLVLNAGPLRMLVAGLLFMAAGGGLFLAASVVGSAPAALPLALCGLFVAVSSVGLVGPNATALALENHPTIAGTGAAVLGICQYGTMAALAPLVGIGGPHTAVPTAAVMTVCGGCALVLVLLLRSRPGISWSRS